MPDIYTLSPSTPIQGKKRPAPDDAATEQTPDQLSTTILTTPASNLQDGLTDKAVSTNGSRATSPALSSVPSISGEPTLQTSVNGTSQLSNPPQKKRRLTPAEKEALRIEKEQKAKEKEARKQQREEEQRAKDEEKRKKNEEKEEKRREKELIIQQKEQARLAKEQAKEEELAKKERAQPKLMAFFGKPAAAPPTAVASMSRPSSPVKQITIISDDGRRKSISLEPTEIHSPVPLKTMSPEKQKLSDFQRCFLPFSIPSHTVLAPYNPLLPEEPFLSQCRERLDAIADGQLPEASTLLSIVEKDFQALLKSCKSTRGHKVRSVKDLMSALHGSPSRPISLEEDGTADDYEPLRLIRDARMKYLHFGEDVRPPYFGTFTKVVSQKQKRHLALNPTSRTLPEVNYDYDSEAEWEEPEEGEDIGIDDDEEEEEDGDEDMAEFLDDEEDPGRIKRGPLSGDLQPLSTGICWENSKGKFIRSEDSAEPVELSDCRMGFLLTPAPSSIDPFSTSYWYTEPPPAPTSTPFLAVAEQATLLSMMNPPRLPLSARPNASNTLVPKVITRGNESGLPGASPKPLKRMIAAELMEDFKREIEGSDMTQLALIEALKKRFPKQPKDAISNTLKVVAARVGDTNATKRWRLFA